MISALTLRIIACVTMLIDHIGYLYGIMAFRYIGRLAFPIFAFLLVNGYRHTRDVKKYMLRLAAFAVVSEIPYNLFFGGGQILNPNKQNVFITLLLGLCCIILMDIAKKRHILLSVIPVIFFCYAAFKFKCDYDYIGILTVVSCHVFYNKDIKSRIFLAIAMLFLSSYDVISFYSNLLIYNTIGFNLRSVVYFRPFVSEYPGTFQIPRVFALIPIFLYSGKEGWQPKTKWAKIAFQYGFYLFYPAHITVLYLIEMFERI